MALNTASRSAPGLLQAARRLVRPACFLGAIATVAFWPGHAGAAAVFALKNLVLILPMIAIGLFLTAGIRASGSMALIAAIFRGRPVRMIALAAFIGALTPVCGVSVLPLVAGLLAGGVPLAPIVAFWLSSPITSPGMLAVTAGTLGTAFAVGKTLAAFLIGIFGGAVTAVLVGTGCFRHPARSSATLAGAGGCDTGCGGDPQDRELRWRFWHSPARRRIFLDSVLANGRLMLTWLSIAFLAEYLLQQLLPPAFIGRFAGGDDWWSVPLSALVGAPVYLDGFAALPLIRGLMDNGMGPGPAMAFLIAGGITSAWAAIPVFALVRLPVFLFYLIMAVLSAVLSGWAYGLAVS